MVLRLRNLLFGAAFAAVNAGGDPVWPAATEATQIAPEPVEWSTPVKPFRIVGNVYYVGSQGLSAYLLVSPQGAVLLDGTVEKNAGLIERNIQAVGVTLKTVKLLISDHAHNDHVGALARIKADTGARFLASAGDRWALEHGRPRGDTNYHSLNWPRVKVDHVIHDGEIVHLGDIAVTAVLTPGHTPGCTSWSTTVREGRRPLRVLFLCSITVAGNVLVGNRAYPNIVQDYRATFRRLGGLKADVVLTSHPEIADVLDREVRREAGDNNAFIDPTALATIVASASANFEKSLAEATSRTTRNAP
jgi:metallo-beta-lactamase class B